MEEGIGVDVFGGPLSASYPFIIPASQIREKTEDGSIQKATVAPHRPGMVTRHTTQVGLGCSSRKIILLLVLEYQYHTCTAP